ncbi:hypothetical protein L596_019115 [Steinernema carpocapsae]|uniref:Uncharacterized protein n=1 Tax=Steinernema carpocapsae TaxID=34508 RepID=A0A4U5N7A7_STECR|nr:hypothetical protein L596_019115 [Steinernema carpocapsae]
MSPSCRANIQPSLSTSPLLATTSPSFNKGRLPLIIHSASAHIKPRTLEGCENRTVKSELRAAETITRRSRRRLVEQNKSLSHKTL